MVAATKWMQPSECKQLNATKYMKTLKMRFGGKNEKSKGGFWKEIKSFRKESFVFLTYNEG